MPSGKLYHKDYYIINSNILEIIRQYLPVKDTEKKLYGEVFTPVELISEMLDQLPEEVWSNPNLQWLDPANGIGNFPVVAYYRLMEGLQRVIPEKQQRSKHIIGKMLYMVELNPVNCKVCKRIFNMIDKTVEPNIIQADFLEWKAPNKFDIIMGNPPYQTNLKKLGKKSTSIWEFFFHNSLEILNVDKYLLFIHPCSWREPQGIRKPIFDKIMERDLVYLFICSYIDIKKYFKNVATNFDYYLLKNSITNKNITLVNDIDDNEYKINLNNYPFIPSGKFEIFDKLIIEEETDIIVWNKNIYHIQSKHMSKTKSQDFKFPCVYTIGKSNGIKLRYSSIDKGMFGIPKVIWSNGAPPYVILDLEGEYGLTEFAYAILDDPEVLPSIKKAMESEKFVNLMKYCVFAQNHKYNWKVIKTFKKDFWKEFI